MYSEQGFEALIRCVALHGFQRLIVVSYWIPGSPQIHAASAIRRRTERASWVASGWPVVTAWHAYSRPASTASMNSSVTRTVWFAFWKSTLL